MRKQYKLWEGNAWDIDRLVELSAGLPVTDVALTSITEVDSPYWFNGSDELPTVRNIVEHVRLIEVSICPNRSSCRRDRVMDGMHRIARAMLEGLSTVKAVRFTADPDPDYVNLSSGGPSIRPILFTMKHVVVLGRGGAGKSTFASRLGTATGLPVIELDKHFWAPDLTPTPKESWTTVQHCLISGPTWILDGDLGPYDSLAVRLRAADTVVVLDLSLARCAWRALRRSHENMAFWRWMIAYRRRSLPLVMAAIAKNAGHADVHLLRTPHDVERFLARAERTRS